MPERVVKVQGYGTGPARPDGVRLRLRIRRVAQMPDAALEEAAERSHALESLLQELGIDRSAWTTDLIAVTEERRWDDKQQQDVQTGYSATAGLVVLLKDLSQAGPLMREAVDRTEAQIAGPWWHVAPENAAVGEACRRAVEDAIRKAEALASALGTAVGDVRSVTEPSPTPHPLAYQPTAGFVGLSSPADEEMTLQPGGLEIGVSVEVAFDLEGER
jgi:uncharacterized protein YggE